MWVNGALTCIPILVCITRLVGMRCSAVLVCFSCFSNCYYMFVLALMFSTVPTFFKGTISEMRDKLVRLFLIDKLGGINISLLQGVGFSIGFCIIVFAALFCPVARFHKGVIFEMSDVLAMLLLN